MTATWVALIARSRIISNRQYIPCSLYQTCLVHDTEPTEMVADINRTALLGGEPVEMACEVNEGNRMQRKDLQLPKAELYCKERHQHSGNATGDVPSTQKLLLKGEWTVLYVSGELLTTTVEPYADDGDRNARVYLGGTHWRAGDTDCPGNRSDGLRYQADRSSCQTDGPRGEADTSRAWTDTLKVSDSAEMNVIGHEEGAGTYLSIGDAKHLVKEMDGVGNHADVSIGHGDVPSVNTDVIKPTDTPQIVSIPRKKNKPPDIPDSAGKWPPDEPNSLGDRMDTSSVRTYAHCIGNDAGAAENEMLNVRKSQTIEKSQDSLYTAEIESPKRSYRWRKVSIRNIDVYIPWNAPIEVLGRAFEFGEVKSTGKAIAPIVKGERAGDGDGSRNRGNRNDERDGDGDSTMSGGSIDSTRVNEALLAGKSQHTCQTWRTRDSDLPVSSWPPIRVIERPYGAVRQRH